MSSHSDPWGDTFVEVHCAETGSANPHEAIYLIGRDETSGKYVVHLFDTFDVRMRRNGK